MIRNRDVSAVHVQVQRALACSAASLMMLTSTAYAQERSASAEAPPSKTDEIVVTGSLIKRADFETPSPVQTINAQDMAQSGFTSVKDILTNISANGQGTLSQSFPGAFAGGASGIALRGLTVGATLTLIDGERMVAYPLSDDGERAFVDVSSIPLAAVERVDVLKDGASAAYGSDAIAGVVNVVLKKNFQGFEVSGEGGTTIHGDGTTERASAIAGIGDLVNNGYNAFVSVEFRHQDSINAFSRSGDFTRLDWTGAGGINATPGAGSVFNQIGATPYPRGTGIYLLPKGATSYQQGGIFLNPACPNAAAIAADQCTFLPSENLQPETQNLNVLARLTKTLGANWTGTLTASVFDSGSRTVGNYGAINPNANPFNVASQVDYGPGFAKVITIQPITVPVGNPMNPTNQPLYPVGLLREAGLTSTGFATDTYRVFADFAGPLAGWDFDVNLGEMYALTTQTYNGVRDYAALQAALNNGYVFGTGGAAYAAVDPTISSTMSNSLQVADIHASRELFTLPGGPLQLALGAGYYHNYLDATQSPEAISGQYSGINLAYAFGGLTDFNGYGEIVAPITSKLEADISARYDHYNTVGGAAVPKFGLKFEPIEQLSLRGTWGKGFRAPNPAETSNSGAAFLFSRSADAYLCPSSGPANPATGYLNPPVTPTAGDVASYCSFSPVYEQGTNPNLKPERSTNFTAGFVLKPIPQVNLSVDYWSIDIKNLVLTNSLFPTLPFPPAPLNPVRTGPLPEPVLQANGTTVSTLESMGEPVYTSSGYVNAGEIEVNGIDVDLATHFDLGNLGRLSAQLNLSHELTWIASSCYGGQCASVELAGTHGPSGVSGDTANPKTRGVFTLSWDRGPLDVTVTVNYVGGYSLNDPSLGESTCSEAVNDYSGKFSLAQDANGEPILPSNFPTQYCHVPSFTYVNLYSQYQFGQKLTVFGSVVNLFNTAPPVDLVTYGAGLLNYNAALAQAGAVGALFDVGFKYRF